ncbi:hypothetical protein HYX13_05325 [Candidatus Woesearchaeota archaeon]|nr:hypothetical protein [Candidatus Woesearchaeota archaeon]
MIDIHAFGTEREAQKTIQRLRSKPSGVVSGVFVIPGVYLPFAYSTEESKFGFVDSSELHFYFGVSSIDVLAKRLHERINILRNISGKTQNVASHAYTYWDTCEKPISSLRNTLARSSGFNIHHLNTLRYCTEQEMEEFQQGYLKAEREKF